LKWAKEVSLMVIFCDDLWRESEGVAEYKNGNKAALRVTAALFW
jgi:hypothetical protein